MKPFDGNALLKFLPKNAGAHNSIYRGEDITDLFYDGTLSNQIEAGTFDDIFVGDYIIGQNSGRKYLVAELDYRLHTGDTECTTHHVLMLPEKSMETAKMNDSNITTGAYANSKMHTQYLEPFKTIISNDFGTSHILTHREYFQNAVTNGYSNSGAWYSSDIELMNEIMVYGSNIFNNIIKGTSIPDFYTVNKTQLALFRYRPDLIVAEDDIGAKVSYWLRDVVSGTAFANIASFGVPLYLNASTQIGVRPAFLLY